MVSINRELIDDKVAREKVGHLFREKTNKALKADSSTGTSSETNPSARKSKREHISSSDSKRAKFWE